MLHVRRREMIKLGLRKFVSSETLALLGYLCIFHITIKYEHNHKYNEPYNFTGLMVYNYHENQGELRNSMEWKTGICLVCHNYFCHKIAFCLIVSMNIWGGKQLNRIWIPRNILEDWSLRSGSWQCKFLFEEIFQVLFLKLDNKEVKPRVVSDHVSVTLNLVSCVSCQYQPIKAQNM